MSTSCSCKSLGLENSQSLLVSNSCNLRIRHCFRLLHVFFGLKRPIQSARFAQKAFLPPVAMCCGKRLRCLIPFFVLALDAAQAVRPGVQPSALTAMQTGRRECRDIEKTMGDEELREEGVKKKRDRCYCEMDYYPSNGCGEVEEVEGEDSWGDTFRSFRLSGADPSCRCLSGLDKARERSTVVEAAAVRFCAAVVEATSEDVRRDTELRQKIFIQKDLRLTPQLCQEVLTGTLTDFGASQESKDVFDEANSLSHHKNTKGFGRLDPLVAGGLPAPKEYQKLLHHVCKDECEEIVNETVKNIHEMSKDVRYLTTPSEESCADRVVRRVEAEVLGCCGRSCGWNGRSCVSWPFLTKNEKVEWLQQCCSEYNVLQNSSREEMCISVLSPNQVRLVSQFDTKAKKGDVAGAYMGQDPRLLWAKPGLDHFQKQLKKLKQKPKANQPVSSDFFEKNPTVRQEGLRKGWFREEKDPQEESSSLVEIGADTCEDTLQKMKENQKHCTKETWRNVLNTCMQAEKWQISDKPIVDEDELDGPPECQLKMINPSVNEPTEVATPELCLKVDFGKVVKRRFFIYNKSDPPEGLVLENPILCFPEKEPCKDGDDFDRKRLNEVDRSRFSGFADYIYWVEESQ